MKLAISRRTPPAPSKVISYTKNRLVQSQSKARDYPHTHTHTHCCIWLELIRGIFLPSGNRNTTEGDGGGKRWVGDVLKLKHVHEPPPPTVIVGQTLFLFFIFFFFPTLVTVCPCVHMCVMLLQGPLCFTE